MSQLAIHGGPKAFDRPFPKRFLFGEKEKQAAIAVFNKAISSGVAIHYNGEEEEAYCSQFAQFMGGGYCDGVNSGTSAIYVALRALEIPPFTEVIVSPITDAGGAMPVALTNCIPVVPDTNLESYNTGPEQIEARITEQTSAIIVGHISGIPVDMDPIMEIARSRGIKVIEDCAQAHGARYKGRLVGTMGDVSAFSTMSIKHHGTAAQGGVVFTRDREVGWRVRRASDRGKPFGLPGTGVKPQAGNVIASLNLNSNDLSAAVGSVQLAKLPTILAERRRVAHAISEGLQQLDSVRLVGDPLDCEGAYWFLVFSLDPEKAGASKQQYADALAAEGLPVVATYVAPVTECAWFKNRAVFGESGYPWAAPQYKGNPNMPLPMPNFQVMDKRLFKMEVHENLSDKDVKDILAAFRKVEDAYA